MRAIQQRTVLARRRLRRLLQVAALSAWGRRWVLLDFCDFGIRRCICLVWFAKYTFRLLRRWSRLLRPSSWHRTRTSSHWPEAFIEHLDEIRGKQAHSTSVPMQPAHPPRSISCIETFYQVPFYEPKVFLRFSSPRVYCPTPAGKSGWKIWSNQCHRRYSKCWVIRISNPFLQLRNIPQDVA